MGYEIFPPSGKKRKRMATRKAAREITAREREKELVKRITQEVKKELSKRSQRLVPVGVKFKPGDWKVYTYLAPKDHGLKVGDRVETPTGPARVDMLAPGDYEPAVRYKKLVGKYSIIEFEYGDEE